MAIITTLKCEVCEAQTPSLSARMHRHWDMPDDWFLVFQGSPEGSEGYHFCSRECLASWAMPQESDWEKLTFNERHYLRSTQGNMEEHFKECVRVIEHEFPHLKIQYRFNLDAVIRKDAP